MCLALYFPDRPEINFFLIYTNFALASILRTRHHCHDNDDHQTMSVRRLRISLKVFSLNSNLRIFEIPDFRIRFQAKQVRTFDFSGRHGKLGPMYRVELDSPGEEDNFKGNVAEIQPELS